MNLLHSWLRFRFLRIWMALAGNFRQSFFRYLGHCLPPLMLWMIGLGFSSRCFQFWLPCDGRSFGQYKWWSYELGDGSDQAYPSTFRSNPYVWYLPQSCLQGRVSHIIALRIIWVVKCHELGDASEPSRPSTFRDWDELRRSSEQYKWRSSWSQFYLGRGGGVKNSRRPVFIKKPTPTRGIFPVMGFAGNLFDGYLFGFYIISYHNDLWIC